MEATVAVLHAVAKELAQKAKASLPRLRENEKVQREWLDGGVYYRETNLNGNTYLGQYNFKRKSCDFALAG